jgi:hypothetical protein
MQNTAAKDDNWFPVTIRASPIILKPIHQEHCRIEIHPEMLLEMYRRMVRIREFELAAIDLFKRGQVKGTIHPYIGQEASAVGVCLALRQKDLVAGTHRSHGHNIAKGDAGKSIAAQPGPTFPALRQRQGLRARMARCAPRLWPAGLLKTWVLILPGSRAAARAE